MEVLWVGLVPLFWASKQIPEILKLSGILLQIAQFLVSRVFDVVYVWRHHYN